MVNCDLTTDTSPTSGTMPTDSDTGWVIFYNDCDCLLPEGPYNEWAKNHRDSRTQWIRTLSPFPEAGARPGPEMRSRAIRLQVRLYHRVRRPRIIHLRRSYAYYVARVQSRCLPAHTERVPDLRSAKAANKGS